MSLHLLAYLTASHFSLAQLESGGIHQKNPPTIQQTPLSPTPFPPAPPPLTPPASSTPLIPQRSLQPNNFVKIKVQGFRFQGNTVFNNQELEKVLSNFVGQEITFADLSEISDKVTDYYVEQGYINSGAYIGVAQNQSLKVDNAIVTVSIVEGRIEKINIVGGNRLHNYIRARIPQPILNSKRLLLALQLLQQDPLIEKITASLKEGSKPSQAIKIQEQLKFAEVENFLRCGKFAENTLDARLDRGLKDLDYIVYLIKLDDRVEVLVKTSQNIYRHTIDLDTIVEPLTNFFNIIQNLEFVDTKGYNFLTYSQAVYQLLIQPIKQYLPSSGKIGFVLDSYFQNLPLDMLHDGQEYLLEKYIISVGSSAKQLRQSLLKPATTLASGVSQIGPSFSNPIVPRDLHPLPQVRLEIENIKKANPSAITLLDSEFTRERFSKDIENNSFWAIHLSSHAQFSSDIEQTFVLAWDTPLMVNDLKGLLQNKSNLDLLVLSACQTAKGDRRSFLGIAGIAAQAGARGVLASLWLVDADSTAQLMTKFYEGLKSGLTKAEALRTAQLSLLKSDKYFHPYYWSAFILVGG